MSAVSTPTIWVKPALGSFISILGPHCPSNGQKKILDYLALQETPCLVSTSLNHTLFGTLSSATMWLLIHFGFQDISCDTSPLCILILKLWEDLKKTVLLSRIFGEVFENPLSYSWGYWTEGGKKGFLKNQGQSLNTQLLGTQLENWVKQEDTISNRIEYVGTGFIQNYGSASA